MIDLRPDHLALVRVILQAEAPGFEVRAFGSRAAWTAADSSDLDLAVVSEEPIPYRTLSRLRQAFAESYLPFKVDVVDFSRASKDFQAVIEAQYEILQKPGKYSMKNGYESTWRTLPLGECVETIIDCRGKTPAGSRSGIPLITTDIVKNGKIGKPKKYIAPGDYEDWMRGGTPRAGDVILTVAFSPGEAARLDDPEAALGQGVVALRGKKDVLDNDFFKYLLKSDLVQAQLRSRADGFPFQRISQIELRKINLLLPPLYEQRAIAHILNTLDKKIDLDRQVSETLEEITRILSRRWLAGFDFSSEEEKYYKMLRGKKTQAKPGEIPADWIIKTLVDRLKTEVETLISIRDLLLPRLMSGEIRVKEVEK